MKKKLTFLGIIILVLLILTTLAVPVFADGTSSGTTSTTTPAKVLRPLMRLLLVQDAKKVDGYIATAVSNGKLTADQAVKVKEFWTKYHTKFTNRVVLTLLLQAKDQTKVQAFLDKQVAAGKIQQAQADKVMQIWVILHAPVTAK